MSPEHGYYDSKGQLAFLSPAPTLDVAMIRELFPHCIEAGKLLGVDEEFRGRLEAALDPDPAVPDQPAAATSRSGSRTGSRAARGITSRPNFPFFPGSSITLRGDPELAARDRQLDGDPPSPAAAGRPPGISPCGRGSSGATRSPPACGRLSGIRSAPTCTTPASNQSDCNFGYTAGVAEALLQSHAGEISLLPALPTGWTDGSVTGLRARGGFEVSMQWKNGKLQSAEVGSSKGGDCTLRYGERTTRKSFKPGQVVPSGCGILPRRISDV